MSIRQSFSAAQFSPNGQPSRVPAPTAPRLPSSVGRPAREHGAASLVHGGQILLENHLVLLALGVAVTDTYDLQ